MQELDLSYAILPWHPNLKKGEAADPTSENLSVTVKKGDHIGFSVEHGGNYASTTTRWPVTIQYGANERYASTDDSALGQGPIWFYDVLRADAGILAPLDDFLDLNLANEKGRVRVASQARTSANSSSFSSSVPARRAADNSPTSSMNHMKVPSTPRRASLAP